MNTQADLEVLLHTEWETAQFLSEKLDAEQQCLVEGPIGQLESIVSHKVRAFEKFQTAHTARVQAMCLSSSTDTHSSALDVLKKLAETHPNYATMCHALIELFQKMARTNETNGILIKTRQSYNKQALNALLRNSQSAQFYGPDGRTRGNNKGMRFTV